MGWEGVGSAVIFATATMLVTRKDHHFILPRLAPIRGQFGRNQAQSVHYQ